MTRRRILSRVASVALMAVVPVAACSVESEPSAVPEAVDVVEAAAVANYEPLRVARLSVKVILDDNDMRPGWGDFNTDGQIRGAVDQANGSLQHSGADWRIELTEIVDVAGISDFYHMSCQPGIAELEAAAEADPAAYAWRDDAINLYIPHTLQGCSGICAWSDGDHEDHEMWQEAILIQNVGIPGFGNGWLHEIGHYFDLHHTFELTGCGQPDQSGCTGSGGGGWSAPYSCCADTCPDWDNVMSYHFSAGHADLTACQLDIAEASMDGDRQHVMGVPTFIRGDANSDGRVDLSDAITINHHVAGLGADISCMEAADANDDGVIDFEDSYRILHYLFTGQQPPPPDPGPNTCGPEPLDSEHFLGCAQSSCD